MMETPRRESRSTPTSPAETLDEVHTRLVGIYASVAESLSTDPTIVPWVERELCELLGFIKESRAGTPGTRSAPRYASDASFFRTDKPRSSKLMDSASGLPQPSDTSAG